MASAVATAADQLTASHPRARSSLVVVGSALSSHLVKNTYGYMHTYIVHMYIQTLILTYVHSHMYRVQIFNYFFANERSVS